MGHMNKIKYSLVFNRKGILNQYGQGLIQIRAYQNGKSRYFSSGIYLKPGDWDKRNKRVKYTHPNQFVYNQRINELCRSIEAFEIRMINRFGTFPLSRLHEFQEVDQNKEITSFTEFFEKDLAASRMKPNSHKMYALTLRKLKDFRKIVYFEEISYQLVIEFDRYLFRKGLGVNSVKKHHHRLKTFIMRAVRQDYLRIDDNPYNKFKPKSSEPERPYLTEEDILKIEQASIPDSFDYLNRVRDIFLLATYTGLRFSDVISLTLEQIQETSKGLTLTVKAEKTGKTIVLPLYNLFCNENGRSRPEVILLKYQHILGNDQATSGIEFLKISNQYFNRALKQLAKVAGVKKRITAHVARRTFATIMATRVKAPVLQRLLQHSRPDMTSIYIQLSNELIERELENIEWNGQLTVKH